ncbi:nuclear transport factor 2 family protein [Ornithinimicrobium sp. W1679]|uniref:nuclear transport factor 2 family protein n=1 Tax=Ornithinimicrobium sp. W1679 TaxID=3418770 RepID=UPI003CE80C17
MRDRLDREGGQPLTSGRAERVRALYQAFNDRDLDVVISAMAPDVDWPNGWEGGRLLGSDDVRQYWERQWAQVRPTTTVRRIVERPDGTVEAQVRMVVRDPDGTVLTRSDVVHVYEFAEPLVQRMSVEEGRARR